ncbi:GerAB/ArcD/ProY family transporter [Paenibacillus mucilaginosus]|uniref:Spore germination protein KB n=3 Tax=Paenibacillus mucilaginosus TaxID=61624 RepID=H6N970_9BACL|nr:GerAB/ArcD/ProY family transporter [Paenibacillus mucilaginosus]AEI39567.1 spore germination protein KB [Paenibacillus mucilaginosus KNP414]AFC27816.1 spore germination protein KB [Paenibacillus mucilaginosus 3016]AFH59969.1 spore germination protein KB [Paenibacillus mucilaginosus K02]MCG7214620.1 spore germination protein [Paenibacillus mucilaginosus]WDM28519.1 GerAB/ArcD/ProY family transporter [Paenibacillus mucilaginosus]
MKAPILNARQLYCLVFLFELGSAVIVGLGMQAERDAWLAILIGMSAGLLLAVVFLYVYRRHEGHSLIGILQLRLGPAAGRLVGGIYVAYFLYIAARVLRDFGEVLVTTILNQTPLLSVNALMVVIICWSLSLGMEVIGRSAEIIIRLVSFMAIVTVPAILASDILEPRRFLPVLEKGLMPVLQTAFPLTLTFPFGETIVFLMVLPHLCSSRKAARPFLLAMLTAGLTLTAVVSLDIAVLGPGRAAAEQFPLLAALGKIQVGEVIQRLDAVALSTLILGGYFKITIFTYAGVRGLSELTRTSGRKAELAQLAAIGLLILAASVGMSASFPEHIDVGLKKVPYQMHLPLQVGVPVLLALLALVFSRRKRPYPSA